MGPPRWARGSSHLSTPVPAASALGREPAGFVGNTGSLGATLHSAETAETAVCIRVYEYGYASPTLFMPLSSMLLKVSYFIMERGWHFYPGLRASRAPRGWGCRTPGAEPTHPEGSKECHAPPN